MNMTKTMIAHALTYAAMGSMSPARNMWGTAPDRGKVGVKRKKKSKTFGKNKRK